VPLGPFGAKNFCTSISPWIVTLDALEPYRVTLGEQDPLPFTYLNEKRHSSFYINLEVFYKTLKSEEERIISSNFKYLYWSIA
jgi:fumarylacetoacetase